MSQFAESYTRWLADFYLLATILLALSLIGITLQKQPVRRLAVAKSTLVSLILLAVLCAIPGWSVVHLLTEERPQPVAEFHDEVSAKHVMLAERVRPIVSKAPPMVQDHAAVPAAPDSRLEPSLDFHLPWPALLAITHFGGATCIVLWLVLGWIASARLRRTAKPAPTDLVAVLNQVFGQTLASAQRPQLLTHERIDVAVALGAFRPTILLPGRWIRNESPDHLRTVLAHESTHIVNHDLRWVALIRMLFIALWANPLFWITRRWLRRDQEALADAAAADLTSRQRYAEQLVAWARDAHSRPALHLSSAVGLWEGPSQLRQRIALLIDEHFVLRRECPRAWRLASYLFCATAALALSLVTLAAGPVDPARPDLRQTSIFQHGIDRLGMLPQEIFKDRPEVQWKVSPSKPESSPDVPSVGELAVSDGVVYGSDGVGRLFAMDSQSGQEVWACQTDGSDVQAPFIQDQTIYYACGKGIVALDRKTGTLLWDFEIAGGAAECSPIVIDNKLFITGYDGVMRAIDATSGKQVWERELLSDAPDEARGAKGNEARIGDSKARPRVPASDGRTIYQPIFDQMRLVAVDAATGEVRWSFKTDDWIFCNPVVHDGRVYIGSQDRHMYCLDAQTGKEIWRFKTISRIEAGGALCDGRLYFGCCAGVVYCVDAKSGKERWRFSLDQQNGRSFIYCAPLITRDGTLYIAGMEGQVYCLDAAGGRLRWKVRPSDKSEIDSNLATDGERLFIATRPTLKKAGESAIFALGKTSADADRTEKDKSRTEQTKFAPADMDTLEVRITDANGEPIKGATVKPYGMRSGNDGGHYAWFTERPGLVAPTETTSDDDGIATVRYPRFVEAEKPLALLSLQLSHPDFVAKTADVPIGDAPSSVRMDRGGVVEITVMGSEKPKRGELFGLGGPRVSQGWTVTKEGDLRSPHLADQRSEWTGAADRPNDGGEDVRVVWLPKNRPAQFSAVAHVQLNEGESQSVQVQLQPGVRLGGSLDATVPRPIVGGKVLAVVDSPGNTDWYDWAPIKEDGTFEFESLPNDDQQDVQIMAYCDGYISTTGAADVSQLQPQKVRLGGDTSNYVLEMEPTATAVVKLLNPDRKPVRGVKVYFSPNIFWSNGSNLVGGANYRMRDSLLDPDYLAKQMRERPGLKFQAVTDDQGVAKVANLPAYPYQMMNIDHERFQLPLPRVDGDGARRYFSFMKLSPGDSAEETITLEAKSDTNREKADAKPANAEPAKIEGERQPPLPQPNAKQRSELRRPPNTITGRVVDEKGQPIAGAEALLFRINRIDASRKLQSKKLTDADGRYRFENVINIAKEFPGRKFNPQQYTIDPLEEELVQVFVRAPGRVAGMGMDLRQQVALFGEIFDMTLKPAATLTGRVTGPNGKPIGGALVAVGGISSSSWEEVQSARTKPDGTYVITDAAPYGIEEYRKKAAEQNQKNKTPQGATANTYSIFVSPPVLTVTHPDFATQNAIYNKIPGTQDVKLKPGAVVEGRAVFGDSAKPAAGAIVHLWTSQPKNPKPDEDQFTPNPVAIDARTDADGKYRFTSLPAQKFDLSAEMRGWVNVGIDAFAAPIGKTSTAPNLVLTKGGVISVRLIDDKTGKPIALTPRMRADVAAHKFPFVTNGISRPNWDPSTAANSAGRFELHASPGKRAVMVFQVVEDGELRWIAKPSGEKPTVVDVEDGKTVEVDLPVIDIASAPAADWSQVGTGTFVPSSVQPQIYGRVPPQIYGSNAGDSAEKKVQENDAPPAEKQKQPPAADPDDDHGSKFLRDIRAAAAPLLATMAKEHGYGLKPGQDLVRVAPPFAPIRMEYYRVGHPTQSQAIRRGPSAMVFRWTNGQLKNWGMTFGDSADDGYDLTGVLDVVLGLKSQSIEGAPARLRISVPGDWVVRTGVEKVSLAKQLEKILQNEMSLPIRLEFREVNRPVYVARGNYRLTPLPGHRANDKLIQADETFTTDEIEVFGKQLVPNSGGGGTDHFDVFLDWLGRWIGTPIVSEVTKLPSNQLSWHLNERSPSTKQTRREDHDPKLVLANITAQTGLEFVQETRPVKILFVERSQP